MYQITDLDAILGRSQYEWLGNHAVKDCSHVLVEVRVYFP
jgi:hypothetical protein